jgi:hypothetical protein
VAAVPEHVAIAGLADDLFGAMLLARAVAFEGAPEYVAGVGTRRWVVAGVDVERDFARAADGADGLAGALLLGAGFLGQAIGAARSGWSSCAAIIAYIVAALLIAAAVAAVPLLRRRREKDIFLARLDAAGRRAGNAGAAAKERYDVFGAYLAGFSQTGRPAARLQGWVDEWERRNGRHPWHEELGPNPDGA